MRQKLSHQIQVWRYRCFRLHQMIWRKDTEKKLFSTHVFTTRKFIIQKNIPFKIIYYFLGKGQANLFLYFALLKDSTKKSMKADQIFFCTYFCWIVFAICNEHIGGGVLIKLWPSTALEKFRSKKCFVRLRSK